MPPPGGEGRSGMRKRGVLAAILAMAMVLSGCGGRDPIPDDGPVEFEA